MTPLVASAMALRARLAALQNLGFDVREVCRRTAIDEGSLSAQDLFVPEAKIRALWRVAAAEYGEGPLGLRAGATLPFGTYGVLDYLPMTAGTLGEGLQLLARYWPLVGSGKRVEIASGPDRLHRLRYLPNLRLAGAALHCRDYTLAVMTQHMLARLGQRPIAVELAGPALAPAAEYEEVLGARPSFGHRQTALVFSDREWYAELPGGDAPLVRTLEEHAEYLLAQLPRSQGIVELVAREIAARLGDGTLGLGSIARSLGVSERTLQRHVNLEGCTFEELVDVVRRDAASELLEDRSLSITEIAYLVGYSAPTAFHRAFKRWTGSTPKQARTQQPEAAESR